MQPSGATEVTLHGEARTGVVALAAHDNGRGTTGTVRLPTAAADVDDAPLARTGT